jgi:aminoglycoside phosphotransferase (APT) family kinase protein
MPQFDDPEIARRLLHHLARSSGSPDAVYLTPPVRIQGGFDTTILGFTLDAVPSQLQGPLILRLSRPGADPQRVQLETVAQNTLAGMGYPAPEVMVTDLDPDILGGPFMVMRRVPGKTLAHAAEGFGAGKPFAQRARLLVSMPSIFGGIVDQWVEMQIRLHQLTADTLLQAVTAAGIDPRAVTFEGQLARIETAVEHYTLTGLRPVVAWLRDHRPPPVQPAICHGDFHPLNILADNGKPTGVIDWANVVIADPEMDVGSAIANISTVPIAWPWPLRAAAQATIGAAMRRYARAYRARRPLDDAAVRYYQVFRPVAQLAPVASARATGRAGTGAFHSDAGAGNLIALIRRLSGVSVRLADRVP